MGLACGLQDQRLMARPPARAGGGSGSLTGGKSGNPQVYSLPSPKGYPSTSPARPAGGRAVTGLLLGGPQARYFVRSTASPHTPTREGSPEGRTASLWGSFPHFFPRNGAPAGQAKVPCRFNGVGETPQRAPPVPTAQGQNTKNQPLPSPGTAGFLCVLASLTPPSSAQTPAGSPWRPSSRRAGSGWLQWPPQ